MIESNFWHFSHDPITRCLSLRHKKSWQQKKVNKRLASNGCALNTDNHQPKKEYKMNENEQAKAVDTSCRLRERTDATVIAEIAIERASLDANIQKLKKAIAADPANVSASQKKLWGSQLDAMQKYKEALSARIIDLIDSDK